LQCGHLRNDVRLPSLQYDWTRSNSPAQICGWVRGIKELVWTAITGNEVSFLTSVGLVLYELIRHAHSRSIILSIKFRLHDRSCWILTLFFTSDIPNNFFCGLLLKKIQLTFTAWEQSLNISEDCRGKTHRFCQKNKLLSLVTFFPLVALLDTLFITSQSQICAQL